MILKSPTSRGAIVYDHDYRIIVTHDLIHVYVSDKKKLQSLGTLPKFTQSPLDLTVNQLLGHVHQWLARN